jgi:hypothetical protein
MIYTIKNTNYSEDTIYTLVEYNIEGNIVEVNIAHFQPDGYSIMDGILNRYTTEMYKIFPDRMPEILVYIPIDNPDEEIFPDETNIE